MDAREKPHCGISGVPFMNKTTGADATAASIDFLVSSESLRMDWTKDGVRGRNAEIGLVARGMARRAC